MKVTSNNPAVQRALQTIADRAMDASRRADRKIDVGPGLRSLHESDDTILLEAPRRPGGGGGGSCKRWIPKRGTTSKGAKFLRFTDGTINGILAENFNTEISYTPNDFRMQYIVAAATSSASIGITRFTIQIVSDPRLTTQEDSEGVPPANPLFLLGGLLGNRVYMAICANLSARTIETRKSARKPSFLGAEPFVRFYRWELVQLTEA